MESYLKRIASRLALVGLTAFVIGLCLGITDRFDTNAVIITSAGALIAAICGIVVYIFRDHP